uniref:Uncharacterized protein n=1 Tax=Heliothis virescens TaxID=7102 RepID=A0A2A4JU75_HELVI
MDSSGAPALPVGVLRLRNIKKRVNKPTSLNGPALQQFEKEIRPKLRSLELDPFDSSDIDWVRSKEVILTTAKEVSAQFKSVHHKKNWISDNTWDLIEKRRTAKSEGSVTAYNKLHKEVQTALRWDKDKQISDICEAIEQHAVKVQTKDLHDPRSPPKPKSWIVDDKQGNPLSDLNQVLDRWREYCYELYSENTHEEERCKNVVRSVLCELLPGLPMSAASSPERRARLPRVQGSLVRGLRRLSSCVRSPRSRSPHARSPGARSPLSRRPQSRSPQLHLPHSRSPQARSRAPLDAGDRLASPGANSPARHNRCAFLASDV